MAHAYNPITAEAKGLQTWGKPVWHSKTSGEKNKWAAKLTQQLRTPAILEKAGPAVAHTCL